jgi:hypothetical protein
MNAQRWLARLLFPSMGAQTVLETAVARISRGHSQNRSLGYAMQSIISVAKEKSRRSSRVFLFRAEPDFSDRLLIRLFPKSHGATNLFWRTCFSNFVKSFKSRTYFF